MPNNTFSTGRDVTLSIITPQIGVLDINYITSFTSRPDTSTISPVKIDGTIKHARFMKGWQGSFMVERRDATLDSFWALVEANYWNGVNEPPAVIKEIIQEEDGSITQWRYTGVLLTLEGPGEYAGDQIVKQSLTFLASKKLQV